MCEYTHTKESSLYEQGHEIERSDLRNTQNIQEHWVMANAILNEFQSPHKTTGFSYINVILGNETLELPC